MSMRALRVDFKLKETVLVFHFLSFDLPFLNVQNENTGWKIYITVIICLSKLLHLVLINNTQVI